MTRLTILFALCSSLAACGATASSSGYHIDEHWMPYAEGVALATFLNDTEEASLVYLDDECGIRSDAAREIVLRRADRPFTDAADVESVYRVGPATMEKLLSCAADLGYVPGDADLELLAFLNDRNQTDVNRLDEDCGLHRDTARVILQHRNGKDARPGTDDDNRFDNVSELTAMAQVTDTDVIQLRECAAWFQALPQSGPAL